MSAMAMAHLSDADLIRHIDAEGDAEARSALQQHLDACGDCASRVRRLRGQAELVRTWLVRADHEPRPGSAPRPEAAIATSVSARPWVRAAIIVLLLAAPLAAVPPVRQWVAEQIGLADPAAPGTLEMATESLVTGTVVRFTPRPGSFTVRAEPAAASQLVLGRSSGGPEALLAVVAGTDAPEAAADVSPPVVSDDVLRLPATPGRRYVLRLPPAIDEVVVVSGGRTTRVSAGDLDAGRVLDLAVNR